MSLTQKTIGVQHLDNVNTFKMFQDKIQFVQCPTKILLMKTRTLLAHK